MDKGRVGHRLDPDIAHPAQTVACMVCLQMKWEREDGGWASAFPACRPFRPNPPKATGGPAAVTHLGEIACAQTRD